MIVKGNILVAVATLLLFCGCGKKEAKKDESSVKVGVTTVSVGDCSGSNEYVGTVEASSTTVLSFEIGGNITRLLVKEGDHVAKGQLLGTISPTTLKDSHYATQVTLRQAQDAYNRMKKLHAEGVISEIKWVEIETKLRQAEAAERIAKEQLSHTSLYAPFSGVVTSRQGDVGMNVLPDQPVYKLADVSRMDVCFSVPENDIAGVSLGEKAVVRVKAEGNAMYTGVVKEKGIAADDISHSYSVRLTIDGHGGCLLPGMVCSVALQKEATDGLIIPMGAVELDTDNSRFVWIVRNGRAYRRNVQVESFAGNGVRVVSGLSSGDRIITSGAQKVSEGMSVVEK